MSRIAPMFLRTMTAARQQRKATLATVAMLGLSLGIGTLAPALAQTAAEDRLVVNPETGLANSGYDPVAYFVAHKPVAGIAAFELTQGGAAWRFSNEGNRAAFKAHPEVYTPRFGGYDPVAIVRGRSVPGHPLIWAVVGERLYLFYSEEARTAFLADPGRIIETAERRWPEVARSIGR